MARGLSAIVAAGIVGVMGWAVLRHAQDRAAVQQTPASYDPGPGNDNDISRALFSVLGDLVGNATGQQPSAEPQAAQTAIERVMQAVPAATEPATGSGFDLGALFDTFTGRRTVDVPSTSAPAASFQGLTKAKGTEVIQGVTVQYSMGPKRPYRPSRAIVDITARGVAATYGRGCRMVITSGQEGNLPQHGSNRHKTGEALDAYIIRANGQRVTVFEFDALARKLARMGAKGIGWGTDYMGNVIHVDRVMPGPGQAHTWGNRGRAMRAEITALMGYA
jgi:hypothetical protein